MRGRVVPAHATTDGGNDRERPVSLAALLYNDHACAENFMVRARAARKPNSQVGLSLGIRRTQLEGPLSGNGPKFAKVVTCALQTYEEPPVTATANGKRSA